MILYPLINGVRFDFSSVELNFDGTRFSGVKEISYKDGLEPGEVRGNRAQLIGRTRGTYSAEGSLTLFKSEFQQLISQIAIKGVGWAEASFDAVIIYSEASSPLIKDVLLGCRLKTAEDSGGEGGEPLVTKCDLHILAIKRNGVLPMDPTKMVY